MVQKFLHFTDIFHRDFTVCIDIRTVSVRTGEKRLLNFFFHQNEIIDIDNPVMIQVTKNKIFTLSCMVICFCRFCIRLRSFRRGLLRTEYSYRRTFRKRLVRTKIKTGMRRLIIAGLLARCLHTILRVMHQCCNTIVSCIRCCINTKIFAVGSTPDNFFTPVTE